MLVRLIMTPSCIYAHILKIKVWTFMLLSIFHIWWFLVLRHGSRCVHFLAAGKWRQYGGRCEPLTYQPHLPKVITRASHLVSLIAHTPINNAAASSSYRSFAFCFLVLCISSCGGRAYWMPPGAREEASSGKYLLSSNSARYRATQVLEKELRRPLDFYLHPIPSMHFIAT